MNIVFYEVKLKRPTFSTPMEQYAILMKVFLYDYTHKKKTQLLTQIPCTPFLTKRKNHKDFPSNQTHKEYTKRKNKKTHRPKP